jgi:hypothetical protein
MEYSIWPLSAEAGSVASHCAARRHNFAALFAALFAAIA